MLRPTGDPHWWSLAACADEDVNTFYPPDNARGRRRLSYVNTARTVCGRCKVTLECLRDALNNGEEYGIFGSCDMESLDDQTRAALRVWVAGKLAEKKTEAENRMRESRQFRVHTIGNAVVVMWLEDGLGRSVTADKRFPGAVYAREVSSGQWRRTSIHHARKITFTNASMLSSLVRRMILDDTLPKV